MSHREALESPGSSARRRGKHQQLGPKPSAEPDKVAVPTSNGKEKGRLVRSTSDFGRQDRVNDDVKQKLPRTYSSGPQDGAQLSTRPAPSPSVAEPRPPLKDEKGSLVLSSSPATSPSTSPPGTPLTSSGNAPNSELRKSSAMKRLSHVRLVPASIVCLLIFKAVTARFGFGKTKPLKEVRVLKRTGSNLRRVYLHHLLRFVGELLASCRRAACCVHLRSRRCESISL